MSTTPRRKRSKKSSALPKDATRKARIIAEDVARYSALDAMASSEGGRILVDSFVTDVLGDLDTLAAKYRIATHVELIAICADLDIKLTTLRLITRSKVNSDDARTALEEELRNPTPEDEGS